VDDQCIDCDGCRQTAPHNFTRDEGNGHSYVFRQPQTAEEEAECAQAMRECPVEAIGDDGDLADHAGPKPAPGERVAKPL
jgi:ferredoxin